MQQGFLPQKHSVADATFFNQENIITSSILMRQTSTKHHGLPQASNRELGMKSTNEKWTWSIEHNYNRNCNSR